MIRYDMLMIRYKQEHKQMSMLIASLTRGLISTSLRRFWLEVVVAGVRVMI